MKIGIIGCGQVGSASAYACVLCGIGTELMLVDKNEALAAAQAEDISHATPFAKAMPVKSGSYDALAGSGIVMISAGVSQKPGENRLDLLKRNADVFSDIIPKIQEVAPEAMLLIASNPVDIMTQMATKIAGKKGHASSKIIGSGTILDTARFRTLLAEHLGVSSHSVHAHVLGEHGDSEVLNWSGASISNINLRTFAEQSGKPILPAIKQDIDDAVRKAAYRIIQGKGATWYGIGAGMARLARAIVENENSILTCCTTLPEFGGINDITLSLPHVISAQGIARTIFPVIDETEEKALIKSAEIIKSALDSIGF